MSHKPIEIILLRQLSTYLVMPIFIVDHQGTLLFYNEAAEGILGRRFDETGEVPKEELAKIFLPTDEEGRPLPPEEVPVFKAILTERAVHRTLWVLGANGARRGIEATGFPLIGMTRRMLGGVAIFWETAASPTPREVDTAGAGVLP
jgi:PAS domain-containing protein